jgi:hypothetical protein
MFIGRERSVVAMGLLLSMEIFLNEGEIEVQGHLYFLSLFKGKYANQQIASVRIRIFL